MAKDVTKQKINVKQKENEPEIPVEIIAQSIEQIAKGFRQLSQSRLKESAVITLIVRASGVGRYDVEKVLNHLTDLENLFLKPKGKK